VFHQKKINLNGNNYSSLGHWYFIYDNAVFPSGVGSFTPDKNAKILVQNDRTIIKDDIFGFKLDKKKKVLQIYKNLKKLGTLTNITTKDVFPSFDFGQGNIQIKLIKFKEKK